MQFAYFCVILLCHIWHVGPCRIFLNNLVKDKISKSIYLRIYGSSDFLYYFRLNVSTLNQDCLYSASYLCLILTKFEFFNRFLTKVFNKKLHENPYTGSQLLDVDRRTDRPTDGHEEAAVTFYRFANT